MTARDEKFTGNTTELVYKLGDGTHIHYSKAYATAETEIGYDVTRDGFGRLRVSNPHTLFDNSFLGTGASATT